MVDESKLNIKKIFDENTQRASVKDLASRGIRNVKVLDEATIHELIRSAVDEVISLHTQHTQDERSKILGDARKQLSKLLAERDQFMSKANFVEANKNDLVQQVEKLQNELKLRRQIEEQAEVNNQAQLKEMVDRHRGFQEQIQTLKQENAWVRQEHDRLVEELDRAQTEIKSLKEEIERLRAELESARGAAGEKDALARKLEAARGEVERLRSAASDHDVLREEVEAVQAERGKLAEELEGARQKAAALEARAEEEQGEAAREKAELERKLADALKVAEKVKEERPARRPARTIEDSGKPAPPPPPAPKPEPPAAGPRVVPAGFAGGKVGKGLDIGTVNLVAAEQDEKGDVLLRLKRNAFIDIEISAYTKSMLTRLKVPYAVQARKMYVLGDEAFELANILNRNTRRPMADGLISPKESDALPVMKLLIGSILGDPRVPNEVCFYSVPGEPVDMDLSVAYHRDLFDAVLKALGYAPRHIIEGHAVTFAELADEEFTGIGVSCGGGMFNVCVAYKSMPALTFSSARSGDWVDQNVANALGIKPAKASLLKEKGVDLLNPKSREEDAVAIYYKTLLKYNLSNIAERFRQSENMPTFNDPVPIVFSGGTSMAGNFIEVARAVFKELDFPIPIKELRMAKDPLNATAKGALVAAQLEMAQQSA